MQELSFLNYKIFKFTSLPCTNNTAKDYVSEYLQSDDNIAIYLAEDELTPNIDRNIIWALSQTEGRGRGQNNWVSKRGNLFFSMILDTKGFSDKITQISFVASLALAYTASDIIGNSKLVNDLLLQIKWPNDLLANGAKMAGMLLERCYKVDYLIIGIGVNIKNAPDLAEYKTSYLQEFTDEDIDLLEFLQKFITNFESLYKDWQKYGFAPLKEKWLDKVAYRGENINVKLPNTVLKGKFTDINDEGYLLLEIDNGKMEVIPSGEVFI